MTNAQGEDSGHGGKREDKNDDEQEVKDSNAGEEDGDER